MAAYTPLNQIVCCDNTSIPGSTKHAKVTKYDSMDKYIHLDHACIVEQKATQGTQTHRVRMQ